MLGTSKGTRQLQGDEGRPRPSPPTRFKLLEVLIFHFYLIFQLKNNDIGLQSSLPLLSNYQINTF